MPEILMSDEDIIARCASGALILDIDRYDRTQVNENSLVSRCIALHNKGRIDLLSLIKTPQFSSLDGHYFFVLQNFFCEAIPLLESPIDRLLRTVEVLVEKGGADLAAGMPNDALRSWLTKGRILNGSKRWWQWPTLVMSALNAPYSYHENSGHVNRSGRMRISRLPAIAILHR